MNIIEIPVIGSKRTEKEKLFTLLSDQPLRNFEGLDFGLLKFGENQAIYFYFLNQENEQYFYLWDLLIPHAIGCLVVCDWRESQFFEENRATIDHLEKRYATPLHICSLPTQNELPEEIIKEGLEYGSSERKLYFFDPSDKNSAKKILSSIIGIDSH